MLTVSMHDRISYTSLLVRLVGVIAFRRMKALQDALQARRLRVSVFCLVGI